LLHLETQTMK